MPPPKKRKTVHKVEEITFDKDARTEYLTGFHKRKQARIKAAKAQAEEEARLERIRLRKQVRTWTIAVSFVLHGSNSNLRRMTDQRGAREEPRGTYPDSAQASP